MPAKTADARPSLAVVNTTPARRISAEDLRGWIESGEARSVLDVLVTPDLADLMLGYNSPGETNRKVRRGSVTVIQEAIEQGRWINTGQPIIFSDSRVLNNGQHQLTAIKRAGVPAVLDLRFGVARAAFAMTDAHSPRTGSDILDIAGETSSFQLASLLRLALGYEAGLPAGARRRWPNDLLLAAAKRWPEAQDALRICAVLPKGLRNAPIMVMGLFALRTRNEAALRDFVDVMRFGGRKNHPAQRLHDRLLSRPPGQDSGVRSQMLADAILAWNAYAAGASVGQWWKSGEPFPKVPGLKL